MCIPRAQVRSYTPLAEAQWKGALERTGGTKRKPRIVAILKEGDAGVPGDQTLQLASSL